MWGDPSSCRKYAVTIDPTECLDCQAACGRPVACAVEGDTVVCDPGDCAPNPNPYDTGVVDGRRPPHLANMPRSGTDIASHLARMAFYEAASVTAFEILHGELSAHAAPPALLRSLRRARADEVKHAELAARLARRFGGEVIAPRVRRSPRPRALVQIALENAREGCGRELLGALMGLHQAENAGDASLRAFYATIARDEARHAAVALRLHDWLVTRLDERQRARVRRVWRQTLDRAPGSDSGDPLLGLPDSRQRRAMTRGVASAIAL